MKTIENAEHLEVSQGLFSISANKYEGGIGVAEVTFTQEGKTFKLSDLDCVDVSDLKEITAYMDGRIKEAWLNRIYIEK